MEESGRISYMLDGGPRACIHSQLPCQSPHAGSVALCVCIEKSVPTGLCVVHDGAFSMTGLVKVCADGQSLRMVLFYSGCWPS